MNLKRILNPQRDDLTVLKILIWWELRRIPFNLIISLGLFGSLFCLSFIVNNIASFLPTGLFLVIWVVLFYILANICYSFGVIFHLVEHKLRNPILSKLLPVTYYFGIAFSLAVIFLPCLLFGGYSIVSGHQIKSVYGDLATLKPSTNSFAGTYIITTDSRKSLKIDSISQSAGKIVFDFDSRFSMMEFPYYALENSLSNYVIVDATGKWSIDSVQGRWVVALEFDSICNQNGQKIAGRFYDGNSYEIQNDKPPFGIYKIVGDPDSWEGINLQQQME